MRIALAVTENQEMKKSSPQIKVKKSTHHSTITGDFAERLVLYWLSKSGYECGRFDYTGIDILAAAQDGRLMGISAQCRSRYLGTERESVSLHKFEKARVACTTFGCDPYAAIVADRDGVISCYFMSLDQLEKHARGKSRQWLMSNRALERYRDDPKIVQFQLDGCSNWCDGSEAFKALAAAPAR